MPELSQVVRQRLARRAAGEHPDADTLTAYTELLLPPAERNRVLEHIADCSTCREIVALSLPEPQTTIPAGAVAAPKRAWRWKPAFGMAASLATLAVITAVIIELPRKPATFEARQQSATPVTGDQAGRAAAAPQPSQPDSLMANAKAAPSRSTETSAAGPHTVEGNSRSGAGASNNVDTLRATSVPPPPTVSARAVPVAETGPTERDYVNKQMFVGGQTGTDAAPSVAEIPTAPLPRLAQGQFPPPLSSNAPLTFADLPPQTQDGKVVRRRQLSNPPSSHFGMLIPNLPALGRKAESFAKRSVAIPPGALTFSAMESNALAPAREDQVQAAEAETKDRAHGADLDQSSAFSQRALAGGARSEAVSASWKVSGGNLLKSTDSTTWNAGYGPGDIEFTVVASRGANIWAGGANAALVHSSNSGATWERITLGASASGSITSIEISGVNVHVKSSSGQEWSSQDGGKTWSLDQ